MSSEAKREVWVMEKDNLPVAPFTDRKIAEAMALGKPVVRYVPAVEQACAVPASELADWRKLVKELLLAEDAGDVQFRVCSWSSEWCREALRLCGGRPDSVAKSQPEPLSVRPVVRWFAAQMELALRRNDHKGGWHECEPLALVKRVGQEHRELREAVDNCGPSDCGCREAACPHMSLSQTIPVDVIKEAADVGAMAMMVADHFREGGPSKDQGHDVEFAAAAAAPASESAKLVEKQLEVYDSIAAAVMAHDDDDVEPDQVWERVSLALRTCRAASSKPPVTNPSPTAKTEQEGPHTCGGYAPSPDCRGCFPMPLRWTDGDDDPVWLSVRYHPDAGGGQRDAESADVVECLSANPQLRASVLSAIPGIVVLDEADFHASIKRDLDAFSAQAERTEKAESELARQLTELQGMYAAFQGSGHSPKNSREAAQAIGQMHDAESELAAERARVVELTDGLRRACSQIPRPRVNLDWHLDELSKIGSPQQPSPPAEPQLTAEHDNEACHYADYCSGKCREHGHQLRPPCPNRSALSARPR